MAFTPEQQAAIDDARAKQGSGFTPEQLGAISSARSFSEIPSQYMRSLAQGATFGWSDEIEAALRSLLPNSPEYSQIRDEVRGKLSAWKEANPTKAITTEIVGAIIPTAIATIATGGTAAPAIAPTLGRMTGIGLVEGAIGGAGASEADTATGALKDAAIGGGTGAILSPVAGYTGQKAAPIVEDFLNFTRNKLGTRASNAATSELQRLAASTGKSVDDIVQDIADGRIMAENRTLQAAVRAYKNKSEQANPIITEALPRRAKSTKEAAMRELQDTLSPTAPDNVIKVMKATDDELYQLEKESYKQVFGGIPEVGDDIANSIEDAARRFPDATSELDKIYRERNIVPLFKTSDAGEVSLARIPTLEDAEIVRRALDEQTTNLYKAGSGTRAEGYSDVAKNLRNQLDSSYGELEAVRAAASNRRSMRDAFADGQKALTKNADQIEVDFEAIKDKGVDVVNSYRMGVMDAIRNKSRRSPSLMGRLAEPERQEGAILSIIYPNDSLEAIQKKLDIAGMSQEAYNKVIHNSMTAPEQAAASRIGLGDISASEITRAVSGDPLAAVNMVANLVAKNIGAENRLTQADYAHIAKTLVSENPDFVRRALTDNTAMGELVRKIGVTIDALAKGSRRATVFEGTNAVTEENKNKSLLDMVQ